MGLSRIRDLTMSLDTSAYANGDLLADTQLLTEAFRTVDGTGQIRSIAVLDEDNQTAYTFSVIFLDANVSMGTENSAPSMTDANARSVLSAVNFATSDAIALTNSKVYVKGGLALPVKAVAGTASLGIAMAVITGTPTHTASGIKVRIGIEWD